MRFTKSGLAVACALAALLVAPLARANGEQVWLHGWDSHGQPFDLASTRGQVVALTFCSRYTRDEEARVEHALTEHPGAGSALVVSVIDFAGVPSFAWSYARHKVAEYDRTGRVQHLIDEQSQLAGAFHVDPEKQVEILVIDRDGMLRGRYTGAQVEQALHLIDQLRQLRQQARD